LAVLREHECWAVRLWATVLGEAVKDLVRRRKPHEPWTSRRDPKKLRRLERVTARLRRATIAWLTAAGDRDPGAFAWICRELELPEHEVRCDVLAWAKARR
jgi:hypothetical protein